MSPRPERSPAVVFLGWLLIGIGGLITVTAGACTAIFAVPGILSSLEHPEGVPGLLLMVLIFGGIPILFGIGLVVAGRALARRPGARDRPARPVEDAGERP